VVNGLIEFFLGANIDECALLNQSMPLGNADQSLLKAVFNRLMGAIFLKTNMIP